MKKRKILLKIIPIVILVIILAITITLISLMVYSSNHQAKEIVSEEVNHETVTMKIDSNTPNASLSSAKECVGRAYYKTLTSDFIVNTSGKTKANTFISTSLDIKCKKIKIGNEYEVLTISKGIVSFGKLKHFNSSNLYEYLYTDVINENFACDFTNKSKVVSDNKKYLEEYGTYPSSFTNYVINDDTYLKEPTKTINEDSTITIDISLKPEANYGPYFYRNEIKTSSGTSSYPYFKSIDLKVTIDNDYKVLSVLTKESYIVNKIINVYTETEVLDTFSYEDVSFDSDLDLLN